MTDKIEWTPYGGVMVDDRGFHDLAKHAVEDASTRGFVVVHSGDTLIVAQREDDGAVRLLHCLIRNTAEVLR